MKKNIFFIILLYCLAFNIHAQFCNSASGKCYQQDAYFEDSQINIKTYKYATVRNIYMSATTSVELYMTVYSPCALPNKIDSAQTAFNCKNCKRPFILLIHGGGFRTGCKSMNANECKEFSKRGYVAASIDYRLGWVPGDQHVICNNNFCVTPTSMCALLKNNNCNSAYKDSLNFALYRTLQDGLAAMRFIAHYADNLNINKNYLYIGGYSSGAIIAIGISYLNQQEINQVIPAAAKKLGSLNTYGNAFTDTFSLAAIFNNWGSIYDTSFIKGSKNKIPMIAFHGLDDGIDPYDKGFALGCSNDAYGVSFGSGSMYTRLANIYPDLPEEIYACYGGHGIFMGDPKTDQKSLWRIQKAVCFFNRVRQGDATKTKIQINKNETDISYAELNSISPVMCVAKKTFNAIADIKISNDVAENKLLHSSINYNTNISSQANQKINFILYPNPAYSKTTLQVIGAIAKYNIVITDLTGRILLQKKDIESKVLDLPIQNFANGSYLLQLKNKSCSYEIKFRKIN